MIKCPVCGRELEMFCGKTWAGSHFSDKLPAVFSYIAGMCYGMDSFTEKLEQFLTNNTIEELITISILAELGQ